MNRLPGPLTAGRIFPLICLIAAVCLFVSEFMIAFELTPPGGEPLDNQSNADRHNYGLAILAAFAFVATIVAVAAGSRPAALAVSAAGGVALFTFLVLDLPDANSIGAIRDVVNVLPDARAEPQGGFWLEAIGAVFLGLGGAGMATLQPEQFAIGSAGGRRSDGPVAKNSVGSRSAEPADAPKGDYQR